MLKSKSGTQEDLSEVYATHSDLNISSSNVESAVNVNSKSDPDDMPRSIALAKSQDTFQAHISKIIFENKESAFYIASAIMPNGEEFTIKLNAFGELSKGTMITCKKGSWTTYKGAAQYTSKQTNLGVSTDRGWLAIWISEKLMMPLKTIRQTIDASMGAELDFSKLNTEELESLGLSERYSEKVSKLLKDTQSSDVATKLQEMGIPDEKVGLVLDMLPAENQIEALLERPFALLDIEGISFKVCDHIAVDLADMPLNDPSRIGAGMRYILMRHAADGHSYYPANDTVRDGMDMLGVSGEDIIHTIQEKSTDQVILEDNKRLYCKPIYAAEHYSCKEIARRYVDREQWLKVTDEEIMTSGRDATGFDLTKDQVKAVQGMTQSLFSVLQGGAGTGKTVVEAVLVHLIKKNGLEVKIMAPTGKAAKRAEEVSGEPAETIHRGCGFQGNGWLVNRDNPLNHDVVSVDEFSMLTTDLNYRVIDATPKNVPILMFGDPNQLESIGSGKVAEALVNSKYVNVCKLTEIKRTGAESGINTNAYNILDRKDIIENHDVSREIARNGESMVKSILANVQSVVDGYKERNEHLDIINDIQVLVPMNKGMVGIHHLNPLLREIFNPRAALIEAQANADLEQGFKPKYPHDIFKKSDSFFMRGDKIMKMRDNDSESNLYNGDVGIVIEANSLGCEVQIGERKMFLEKKDLSSFEFAYAMTIHKSQGSEYKHVVLGINRDHQFMFSNNLIYTGLTRAKESIHVVDDGRSLLQAINTNTRPRYCTFGHRLDHYGASLELSMKESEGMNRNYG